MTQKLFPNKYGYFSNDGKEFVITNPETPRPWVNVISNGDFGVVISQAGGGFSWKEHVNLNRLTRWFQDLIKDDWGRWLYLRDVETNEFYSLSYQPVQHPFKSYKVRHGLGYSVFEQEFEEGWRTKWTIFIPKDAPIEVWLVTIENQSSRRKVVNLSSYLEWNLGAAPDINREFHKLFINTRYNKQLNAILAEKVLWEVKSERGHWNTDWPYVGFHSVNIPEAQWDTSKDQLIGRNGSFMNPKGIRHGHYSQKTGRFEDAVASFNVHLELAPGEKRNVIFLTGMLPKKEYASLSSLIQSFHHEITVKNALLEVKQFWEQIVQKSFIESPDPSFDTLTNIWLKYQAISGHMWARTGYYQQSGAYGFRDQLQTSQVWKYINAAHMRDHLVLNARHQFQNGKVLHWWHPLTDEGLKTEMTDDLLWLPYMVIRYLKETADFQLLQHEVPFYDGGKATLFEHCTKAIDVVFSRFSKRGLPLIGEGDWCDGFNTMGLDWKGESAWLGMFLYTILTEWLELLTRLDAKKYHDVIHLYQKKALNLKKALNTHAWNGQWYIAATKDDGTPIGDPFQEEAKIYLMSQTWAVISGIANEERKQQVMEAILQHLEADTGLMLLYPAFTKPDKYVGYITRYAPGLRENGGVYTHAATWGVMALAMAKRPHDMYRIFSKLNPILQAHRDADKYMAEPYVLPGNSDGKDSRYHGRAGWTWYTGSAGWLFTIAHEYIVGVRPDYDGLIIDPCFPPEWDSIKVRRPFRNAVYNIIIQNPKRVCGGVEEIEVDGKRINGHIIPVFNEGTHEVIVSLKG